MENYFVAKSKLFEMVGSGRKTGRAVINADNEYGRRLIARMGGESAVLAYGVLCDATIRAHDVRVSADGMYFVVRTPHGSLPISMPLIGRYNVYNALAAIGAAEHAGVAPDAAAASLARFENVKRRLELRGEAAGVKVYDDFAHHPTAMRTTVDGLRRKVGLQRILAVFEPRSNTMKLGTMKAQLPWALEEADLAFCLQGPYGWDAREALAPMGDKAVVADSVDALVALVVRAARSGDHVLCMSNGGFGGIHGKLLDALAAGAR